MVSGGLVLASLTQKGMQSPLEPCGASQGPSAALPACHSVWGPWTREAGWTSAEGLRPNLCCSWLLFWLFLPDLPGLEAFLGGAD